MNAATKERTITLIPVALLFPHPDNPRKDVGDVSELAESIKANGILQNLTVVPGHYMAKGEFASDGYTVIIGHRRLAAAKSAGLREVPCSIVEMSAAEQVSTMLTENMQRTDLTVYEQAQGFQMMLDLGSTVEEIADKSGFSSATVRRRVKMMELDQKILKDVSSRQLSLSDFDRLAQIEDIKDRNSALEAIGTNDFNHKVSYAMRKQDIAKKTPLLKKQLKSSDAKAIKQNDTWSSKYDRIGSTIYYYSEWDGESDIIPKEKAQVYYYLDENYGSVCFYKAAEKKAKPKKSPEELDREKRISEAWKEEKELAEITYGLRRDFVEKLSANSKNTSELLVGAISAISFASITYTGSDRSRLMELLGMEGEYGYDSEKRAYAVAEGLSKLSGKDFPKLIYAGFHDDGKTLKYTGGYSSEYPKYKTNYALDMLYAWLCSLGYLMSDTEKALANGTHPLFSRGDTQEV